MCLRVIFTILFFEAFVVFANAQNTRNVSPVNPPPKPQYQPEKKTPFGFLKKDKAISYKTYEEETAAFRKKVSKAYKENAKAEQRVEKVKKKEARKGEKFHGHRRPPKKRPPGKQKFCRVCRIKH